jgi:hypothetical protein
MRTLRIIQGLLIVGAALLVHLIWRGSWLAAVVLFFVAGLFVAAVSYRGRVRPVRTADTATDAFRPRIHWRNDGQDPEAANDGTFREE